MPTLPIQLLLRQTVLAAVLAAMPAQAPVGDPSAAPVGLRFVQVDIGQGACGILIGPTGNAMVIDAGKNGQGDGQLIPTLRRLGVTQVQHALVTHYHADHLGGMDELIRGFPVTTVWDRGPTNTPSTISYRDYALASAAKRRTVTVGSLIFF